MSGVVPGNSITRRNRLEQPAAPYAAVRSGAVTINANPATEGEEHGILP